MNRCSDLRAPVQGEQPQTILYVSSPVAARPVTRFPADLSQDDETVLVSTTLVFLEAASKRIE
ncbi:hypothetical protein CN204_37380 [Sinorhizobium meliloti]|nr:hypothetical protein VP03_27695 [Sinorhizobium meliloti]MDW9783010.1 hypothetical protein [Sinorhizobium meliloti]MDX0371587.1 hypothetical protein [Sinorhizobium meliloti]RVH70606.1 hypothetical protein CN204_37380 [Sinorhizobium meliloti]RVK85115.1 hypothetical protein CN150_35605 [Sinorhizobium meliloti]